MSNNFNWDEPITFSLSDKEELPKDSLDRAQYADFLTNYLSSLQDKSYVLNLDCEWGSGKTYFIKRWYESIKEVYPCVYVDAWINDFSDDPLLTIVSAIEEQLKIITGEGPDSQIAAKMGTFLKGVAPELAKGITKKLTGFDYDNVEFNEEDENKEFSKLIGAATKQIILQHNNQTKALDDFKLLIEAKASALVASTNNYRNPLIIFIDELDRCRPNYAVETLETVKHLFDIPNVVFVISTDTKELQHAIKVLYGSGFNSSLYLGRFFNRRFSLPRPDTNSFMLVSEKFSDKFIDLIRERDIWPYIKHSTLPNELLIKTFIQPLSAIAYSMNLELRDIEQITDRLIATILNSSERLCINYLWLFFLLALHHKEHELYKQVKSNPNVGIELEAYARNKGNITLEFLINGHSRKLSAEFSFFVTELHRISILHSKDINDAYHQVSLKVSSNNDKYNFTLALLEFCNYTLHQKTNYFNLVEMASNLS